MEKPVEAEAATLSNVNTSEAGKLALLLIEEAVGNAVRDITGKRDDCLAKLLVAKLSGMDLKLVEQRSADGLTTTWTFESAYPGGALRSPTEVALGP